MLGEDMVGDKVEGARVVVAGLTGTGEEEVSV
jgi:hypothetical protein